jgi:hypothetical protein
MLREIILNLKDVLIVELKEEETKSLEAAAVKDNFIM